MTGYTSPMVPGEANDPPPPSKFPKGVVLVVLIVVALAAIIGVRI